MNWYKKIAKQHPGRRNPTQEYYYAGITFVCETIGKYYPATLTEPSESPEVDIINADIDKSNLEGLWDYIEWVSDDFIKRVNEEIASRTSHFGNVDDPIEIIYNGIRFIIRVTKDPGDWVIIGADMEDSNKFLNTLPEKLKNRISEDISGESLQ